ncbi:MAG TPA: DUF255 domain-containing protein [Candidatus Polarisedimenticolia bacterium]|nr:DUF255 domain-containing protein [Candidatus Polarisedimenticolia bacterium]
MTSATGSRPGGSNRLAGATSPYLLQHKDNPVDWHPWDAEALARARAEDKPIFLSIGYSACHWCHVMEEESFEDPETAALMNRHFVNVKVDREERPDLDDIYMTAVQMMTGSGGWPMSVWLTPDLEPFYGGTYFPRDGRYGRPSFRQVLAALADAWTRDRSSMVEQGRRVRAAVVDYMAEGRLGGRSPAQADADPVDRAIEEIERRFDRVHGGLGSAPKFPPHAGLLLLLERHARSSDENLLRMVRLTLDRMARGGLYDQIGGGFHRYATDAAWQVPHFEKMLYDNALLAMVYLRAWEIAGHAEDRRIVQETLRWTLREMTDPAEAFYSTLDADSEGEEGRFYVWRPEQVKEVLGPEEGDLACAWFGITSRGNFEQGTSIPHLEMSLEELAAARSLRPAEAARRLEAARAALLAARAARERPHLDDKVLTAWNGLMIEAMARAGRALGDPALLAAAERAAAFLLDKARGSDGLMRVSYRAGRLREESFLDDQAFFVAGLVALHEARGGDRWMREAAAIVQAADGVFRDPAGGYYFTPPGRTDLIVRPKNPTDGAIPSGNAVLAGALIRMHQATGEALYLRRAQEILRTFRPAMVATPGAFHAMAGAHELAVRAGLDAGLPSPPSITATARPASIRPGGEARVAVEVEIPAGWHVNAANPSLEHLVPTALHIDPGGPLRVTRVEYPEGEAVTLSFAGRSLAVYRGRVTLFAIVSADPAAPPGPGTLAGHLSYQACNDTSCLPPARSPVAITVHVGPAD